MCAEAGHPTPPNCCYKGHRCCWNTADTAALIFVLLLLLMLLLPPAAC
jgi:hypothetical protein